MQKVHFDALPQNESGQPTVKLDTLLRSDFNGRIAAQTFFEDGSSLEGMFIDMHDRNKKLLSSFLTKEVCDKIGLGDSK